MSQTLKSALKSNMQATQSMQTFTRGRTQGMPSQRNTTQRNFTVSRLQTNPASKSALRLRHKGETDFSDVDVAYHIADGDGSQEMCDALPELPPKSCYLITQVAPRGSVFEAHVIPEFFKLQLPPDFKTTYVTRAGECYVLMRIAGTVVAGHGGSGTSSRSNSVSRTGSMSSTATQKPSGTSSNSGFTVGSGSSVNRTGSITARNSQSHTQRPSGTSSNTSSGFTVRPGGSVSRTGSITARNSQSHTQRPSGTSSNSGFTVGSGAARQSQSHTQRPSGTSSNSGFTVGSGAARQSQSHTQRPSGTSSNSGHTQRPSGTSSNANSGSTAKRTQKCNPADNCNPAA
ncbi:hypothetical protein HYFRA_00001868 [Hymenoscyphus fraxineus]|uniref:Uncharacterized protein n=1 Tax=Hymenoscyphus fraxineus TaxID=746836 RepID=A0A9N9KNJ8_9HELO|nr:hypothetical protein HYFRA_00001868 [Hymenoscyphus fraxineus]